MYKFTKLAKNDQHDCTDVEFTIKAEDVCLDEMLGEFERFLKACGYHFDGGLDVVDETNAESDIA